ncbi:MAG: hypothetical protein H6Q76_743 [Firmicutes bacterium]|nr:hypothetical protein [Bacillota bacterium]
MILHAVTFTDASRLDLRGSNGRRFFMWKSKDQTPACLMTLNSRWFR